VSSNEVFSLVTETFPLISSGYSKAMAMFFKGLPYCQETFKNKKQFGVSGVGVTRKDFYH